MNTILVSQVLADCQYLIIYLVLSFGESFPGSERHLSVVAWRNEAVVEAVWFLLGKSRPPVPGIFFKRALHFIHLYKLVYDSS